MKKTSKLLAILLSAATIAGTGGFTKSNFNSAFAQDITFIKDSYFSRLIPEEAKLREIEKKQIISEKEARFSDKQEYVCRHKVWDYQKVLNSLEIPTIAVRILSPRNADSRYHAVLEALVKNPETNKLNWVVIDPTDSKNLDGLPVEVAYRRMPSSPNAYFNEKRQRWVNTNNSGLESLRKELANNYIRDVLYKKAQESFRDSSN